MNDPEKTLAAPSTNPHDWLNLQGRVCVVTGAGSGIGAAIARSLHSVGAHVALLDKDAAGVQAIAAEIQHAGGTAMALQCDIAHAGQVQDAINTVAKKLGGCWGLVNNAGFLHAAQLKDVTLQDWNAVLSVNLTGALLMGRACAAQMQRADPARAGGSIVNVASIAAHFPQSNSGAYSASKAGLLQLSRQMAVEWGAQGIRSNAICPGMIRTPLSAKFYEVPGVEAKRAAMTANRRVGEAQDIADAALFLLSPRSAYVNGTELAVDGGMPAMLMDMVPRPGYNFPLEGIAP